MEIEGQVEAKGEMHISLRSKRTKVRKKKGLLEVELERKRERKRGLLRKRKRGTGRVQSDINTVFPFIGRAVSKQII